MLKIRLRRVGAKKQPSYRIVIAESTAPRDGKFVETIGNYNPRTNPETVRIQEERALHWLSVGAQPTESVARIFRTHGTMARFERLQGGEPLDALVAEANASASAKPTVAPAKAEKFEAEELEVEELEVEELEADEPEAEELEAEEPEAEELEVEELEDEESMDAASDEAEESQAA
jgi:small subunit ribosomal protein S16